MTVVLRKFFKIIAKHVVSIHFPITPTFPEPLVHMLRYKFREAADLQRGAFINAALPYMGAHTYIVNSGF